MNAEISGTARRWPVRFAVAVFCAGLAAVSSSTAGAQTATLTNASQVRSLTEQEAAQASPVRLEGTVVARSEPYEHAVVINDGTAGIYLLADQNLFAPYYRGDLLAVEGVTDPGGFSPIVRVSRARKLGVGRFPEAQRVGYHELVTGALDAQWVEIRGVVRRTYEPDPGSDIWRVLVWADGGVVPVRGAFPTDPAIQVDAEIRVEATCFYQFNRRRQVLTPILAVPTDLKLHVEKPAPESPFDSPVRSAVSLLQFSPEGTQRHRVHVSGVVLHSQPESLIWMRDQTSTLRVHARQGQELRSGDVIDVLGFPAYGLGAPVLEDAIFRKAGSSQPPIPVLLTNIAQAFEHQDDLVRIECRLNEIRSTFEGLSFTFERQGTNFQGILDFEGDDMGKELFLPGSKVRVAGICSLIHEEVRPLTGVWQPESFHLILRSPADLVIIESPPWWTPTRVSIALGIVLAGLFTVGGIMALVGRAHLKEQTRHRAMAEAEFSAILTERNRVAREIHDTLAQGLAATSVQLRLAKKMASSDVSSLQHHLDVAQQLVGESLREARDSIWNTRSQILETTDLGGALDGILKQMSEGSELRTRLVVQGRPRRFAPVLENNLLRIGQEAITNAIRHAGAQEITVTLDFREKDFRLCVHDDGKGFDPDKAASDDGGFGLKGMRERAMEVKGELTIRSHAGKGTEIELLAPSISR